MELNFEIAIALCANVCEGTLESKQGSTNNESDLGLFGNFDVSYAVMFTYTHKLLNWDLNKYFNLQVTILGKRR